MIHAAAVPGVDQAAPAAVQDADQGALAAALLDVKIVVKPLALIAALMVVRAPVRIRVQPPVQIAVVEHARTLAAQPVQAGVKPLALLAVLMIVVVRVLVRVKALAEVSAVLGVQQNAQLHVKETVTQAALLSVLVNVPGIV